MPTPSVARTRRMTAPAAVAVPRPPGMNLRKGNTGAVVRELQNCLVHLGYMKRENATAVPATFGPITHGALTKFQKDRGLEADGKYGPLTRAALTTALGTTARPVNLKDPTTSRTDVTKVRFKGPLFKDGISANDVTQGELSDCFLASTMSAIAHSRPELIQKLVRSNGDGTYTVKMKALRESDYANKVWSVKVDGDLYASKLDPSKPVFGRGAGAGTGQMETWFPIVEKAYAQIQGGYDPLSGGSAFSMMENFFANPAILELGRKANAERNWSNLKTAVANKYPTVAITHSEGRVAYANSGVYADHAYTVLGVKESGGKRLVQLRNPWGVGEPYTGPYADGRDDGSFWMPYEQFSRYFEQAYVGKD